MYVSELYNRVFDRMLCCIGKRLCLKLELIAK